MTTSKRLTKTQKERAEIFQSVMDLLTGDREATKAEAAEIRKLQEELGDTPGLLRFVLNERDEAEDGD